MQARRSIESQAVDASNRVSPGIASMSAMQRKRPAAQQPVSWSAYEAPSRNACIHEGMHWPVSTWPFQQESDEPDLSQPRRRCQRKRWGRPAWGIWRGEERRRPGLPRAAGPRRASRRCALPGRPGSATPMTSRRRPGRRAPQRSRGGRRPERPRQLPRAGRPHRLRSPRSWPEPFKVRPSQTQHALPANRR